MKKRNNNVLKFREDAELFFRVGLKYAGKKHFNDALKYLKKAVDMEPFDADYQFNYGCVLAELKHTRKSNTVLLGILRNIDPTLSECYFGIGCNHFEMGNLIKAKEYFEKYIRFDLEGQFIDETCDILYYLQIYDEVNPKPENNKIALRYAKEGKDLMGEGLYEKACMKLEKSLEEDPVAIEPRNNLSLLKFMLGKTDQAISISKSVLKLQPDEVEANCNLTLYYHTQNRKTLYFEQLKVLQMVHIEKDEELTKLLFLCSKINEHYTALGIMTNYLKANKNFLSYYLTCIVYINLKQFKKAKKVLNKVEELYPQYVFAVESLQNVCNDFEEGIKSHSCLDYRLQLHGHYEKEYLDTFSSLSSMETEAFQVEWTKNNNFKKIVTFGLYFGSYENKTLAVKKLSDTKNSESKDILEELLRKSDQVEGLKNYIINVLGQNCAQNTKKFETNEIISNDLKVKHIYWEKEWQSIIDCTIKNSKIIYSEGYKSELKKIWLSFVNSLFPKRIPVVKKMEIWSAALEYIYCDIHMLRVSKSELAKKYKISAASLTHRVKDFKHSIES